MLYPPINIPQLRQVVRDEVRQRIEEGCDISTLPERVDAAGDDRDRLLEAYEALLALQPRPGFPFVEPSDLPGIRAARPKQRHFDDSRGANVDDTVADRIHGGWLGRCAGLMLGKPFESSPFVQDAQAIRK